MEGVFLLDNARRQFQKIAADPCLAWLLGWQKDGRIEILNVCRFLSKTGDILQTTDTPYDLDQEIRKAKHQNNIKNVFRGVVFCILGRHYPFGMCCRIWECHFDVCPTPRQIAFHFVERNDRQTKTQSFSWVYFRHLVRRRADDL